MPDFLALGQKIIIFPLQVSEFQVFKDFISFLF